MATSAPCRLIPWNAGNPSFHVTANSADSKRMSIHFTKPHVFYLGSHEGCGCGFRREHYNFNDPDDASATDTTQEQLHKYLGECLENQDFIELYGCWSGEESESADHYREVTINDLKSDHFFFLERELTKVVKQ